MLQQRLWHDRKEVEWAVARAQKHEMHRDTESPVRPKLLADGLGFSRGEVKEPRHVELGGCPGQGVGAHETQVHHSEGGRPRGGNRAFDEI